MRVVVLGATGNIGTALMERLAAEDRFDEVIGVARRLPLDDAAGRFPGGRVTWRPLDVRRADWRGLLAGVDAVVVLAWMFQPARCPEQTWTTNVTALARLLEALPDTSVSHLVVASSVAAYSPHPIPEPVDESWATHGASAAAYAREKAYVERLLDGAEGRGVTLTRLRPAFVFQRRSASEQRRIFAGPLVPQRPVGLLRRGTLPRLPVPRGLRLQAVHAVDVADAIVRVLVQRAAGPFNLCADGVLWSEQLASLFGTAPLHVPARAVRLGMEAAWTMRLLPVPPTLYDAALRVPVMTSERARTELGWNPTYEAREVIDEFLEGFAHRSGHGTAPLAPT